MSIDDTYFDYIYNQGKDILNISFPMILSVHSGELIIKQDYEDIIVRKGESVFLCRGTKVCIYKNKCGDELFCGIYLGFSQIVLSELYLKLNYKRTNKVDLDPSHIVRLPKIPCIQSLYISMTIYCQWRIKLSEYILKLKQQEGVFCLLIVDRRFYNLLFTYLDQ